MSSSLDQLKATGTVVVCDSGDINVISKHKPQDATTNPSLILAASKQTEYARIVASAVSYGRQQDGDLETKVDAAFDHLLVQFGSEILTMVSGKVSTEIDARLSFDTEATVSKARQIIKLYEAFGHNKSRVLIKVAGTWEGIKAAEALQREGINCNVTLIFSLVQAVAAAEAGAYIISPFVGRILDWHRALTGKNFAGAQDPGVQSVQSIYRHFKAYGLKTIVMGASFRNVDEIVELAGCDYLTISPPLLEELSTSTLAVTPKLRPPTNVSMGSEYHTYLKNEPKFRFCLNEDRMAVEKLREGISKFAHDADALHDMLIGILG